jgi:hypothetical protein
MCLAIVMLNDRQVLVTALYTIFSGFAYAFVSISPHRSLTIGRGHGLMDLDSCFAWLDR